MYKYLIGFFKIACDLFALPDFYTHELYYMNKKDYYTLIPFSFLVDAILNFPLGTFFMLDMCSILVSKILAKWSNYLNSTIVLYIVRYVFLYFLGVSMIHIYTQLIYSLCFALIFRIVHQHRGSM